jgi:hypothetical protein
MSNTDSLLAIESVLWIRGLSFALGVMPAYPLPRKVLVGSGCGVLGCEIGVLVQNGIKGVWEFDILASPCELGLVGGGDYRGHRKGVNGLGDKGSPKGYLDHV